MRRITYWLLSTVSALVLLFGYHTSTSGAAPSSPPSAYVAGVMPGTSTAGASSGGTSSGGSSSGGSSAPAKAAPHPRTVTGSVAQTQWGPVQVQLAVAGKKIAGVQVLQHPSGNSTDDQINSYALPILVDSTMKAQGGGIDMVSGATVTSTGYLESLQSALDQAGL